MSHRTDRSSAGVVAVSREGSICGGKCAIGADAVGAALLRRAIVLDVVS